MVSELAESTSQRVAGGALIYIIVGSVVLLVVLRGLAGLKDAITGGTSAKDWGFALLLALGAFVALFWVLAIFMPSVTKAAEIAGGVVGGLFILGIMFG